jgi:selenide,water dikinase
MVRASNAEVALNATAVPLLDGAMECAAAGYLSSLHTENAKAAAVLKSGMDGMDPTLFSLLVDPQTSGGLLASLPAEAAERCVAELREAGYPYAAVVASVLALGKTGKIVTSW